MEVGGTVPGFKSRVEGVAQGLTGYHELDPEVARYGEFGQQLLKKCNPGRSPRPRKTKTAASAGTGFGNEQGGD